MLHAVTVGKCIVIRWESPGLALSHVGVALLRAPAQIDAMNAIGFDLSGSRYKGPQPTLRLQFLLLLQAQPRIEKEQHDQQRC